jgi:4-hydroxybenzoate polyprenyltransferase
MTTTHTPDEGRSAERATRPLRITLRVIATAQLALGAMFLFAPTPAAAALGLQPAAPTWANWLFAMMAARFLGYAVGMLAAARAPDRHISWINTMIGIQAVDWLATVSYMAAGHLTLRQVSTASFLPVLFIAALLWWHPRRSGRSRSHPLADRSSERSDA